MKDNGSVIFSHQIGHDVMVTFYVFPDADNLWEGRAEQRR